MKFSRFDRLPAIAGIAVAVIGLAVTAWLTWIDLRRFQQSVRTSVLQQLSTVRAEVERSLNERIYLTLGLRAYVSTNPNITRQQFASFAAALMQEGEGIRSVTLIKDNIISDVYPLEENETALGLKLLENPRQRDDVLRAIKSRQPWLSTPIKLVQGGEAFINRAPVYETPPEGESGSGRYWGLVSILISKDILLNDIIENLPPDLRLAIRAKTQDPKIHSYIYGDESIEIQRPLTLDVTLPTGNWQVVGVPFDQWPKRAPSTSTWQALGSIISACLGVLTFMLLQSNNRYRLARATAEDAVVQLSRKNEDLEAFIHTASHDLRSPLRHIRIFCDCLIEDAHDRLIEEDRQNIGQIEKSLQRMMELLDSLLRFAKTGTDGIHPQVFSLQETMEQVVYQLPSEKRSQIQMGDLPDIYGDRALLTQVFQNLIENGLKYHQGDDLQLRIKAISTSSETTISFADNGIGLEASQLQRIFKVGVRGVSESEFSGSGFGLAICERIVKAHRGRIWAESTPGQGSTFRITLPNT